MRYTWLTLLILLLDQSLKWLVTGGELPLGGSYVFGPLRLSIDQALSWDTSALLDNLGNSTNLTFLAALLTVVLLLNRWSPRLHFVNTKTAIGLQCGIGGLSSHVVDLLFRGKGYTPIQLHLHEFFTFNVGIADLSLLAGFVILVTILFSGKTKLQSHISLAAASLAPLDLNRLPRGIDNIHIDVHLSPLFCRQLTRTIRTMIPAVIEQLQQGKRHISIPEKKFKRIRTELADILHTVVQRAKSSGEKALPDLFLIALLKYIHSEVDAAVAAELQQTKEGSSERRLQGMKAMRKGHYVEWLFRNQNNILALTNLMLLEALLQKMQQPLVKAVKNLLGERRLFSFQAISSPMLLGESPTNERLQLEHYLVLAQQQSAPNSFVNIDRILAGVFSEYLDLIPEDNKAVTQRNTFQHEAGGVNSNTIDTLSQPSVLMNVRNVTTLLDTKWTERKLKGARKERNWRKYSKLHHHLQFQRRLQLRLMYELEQAGLVSWINAAFESESLIKRSGSGIPPSQLTALLARRANRAEIQQKATELLRTGKGTLELEHIINSWQKIHNSSRKQLEKNLLRFIHRFACYRRDLLLLLNYQRAASQLCLLNDTSDIETSRANYTLYEFLQRSERQSEEARILSHVIVKADLRGSTEVTRELLGLNLNPATHFDRNFFSPINKVIEAFGAEKVFIEGDALILILNEYAGDGKDRLIAARACGLARKMLRIVARQNRELEAYGLPQLELGIGIAFEEEPPRYLFDNQHRITISPAINRADRLSACAWSIRNWRESQGAGSEFVEVYHPTQHAESVGEKAQKDLIYNLNGILLEKAVFERINRELKPAKLHNAIAPIQDSTLYAIHLPELTGSGSDLVLRRAPVRLYDPGYSVEECPVVENRYFYEVLWRPTILEQLTEQ